MLFRITSKGPVGKNKIHPKIICNLVFVLMFFVYCFKKIFFMCGALSLSLSLFFAELVINNIIVFWLEYVFFCFF